MCPPPTAISLLSGSFKDRSRLAAYYFTKCTNVEISRWELKERSGSRARRHSLVIIFVRSLLILFLHIVDIHRITKYLSLVSSSRCHILELLLKGLDLAILFGDSALLMGDFTFLISDITISFGNSIISINNS